MVWLKTASLDIELAMPKREPVPEPIMSRKLLYRRVGSAVISILALLATASLSVAQMPQLKRPQEDNEEKKPEPKKAKKVKGPRAIGLLQLNRSGKGSLIPIAIQVEGKFYDASVYKADPVPMALESGTIYEVEQTGSSQGLFTINGALHSTTEGSPHHWTGSGTYLPTGTEVKKTTRKAEDVPIGINAGDNDAPPRLTRGNSKPAETGSSNTAPASTTPTPAGTGSSDKTAGSGTPPSTPSAGSSPSGESSGQNPAKPTTSPAADKPADQGGKDQGAKDKEPSAKAPQAPSTSTGPSQTPSDQKTSAQKSANQKSENEYRPTLRRGKPTQPAPVEEEGPTMGPIKFIPAISDDGGPEPKSYKFYWKTGEEDERRNQMLALAADELRAYTTALAKNSIPAKPAPAKAAPAKSAAQRKTATKPAAPTFENVQFNAFDVWGNNQPVMILTAEAHPVVAPGSTTAPETYSITLVARADIYGNLRKVYTGVTDKFHLDVTPRLELIDAVDADGDGRGELLFRQTTDNGSGYVIYRPTADKLWKMFESVGG